jgi:hypothetical protein
MEKFVILPLTSGQKTYRSKSALTCSGFKVEKSINIHVADVCAGSSFVMRCCKCSSVSYVKYW